ncbi:putative toxin-antitoxin system toxin component, PIN family [Aurantimonas sp. A2-1-M11]|uniref:putative toxin-antitoxin system toxin component, PIN family n=1 Tax=Aurantimonas sp. A2-1-M11 TaxID=3113712 RepID=UPI002F9579B7
MIVADTNVILRGLRSNKGASGYILKAMLTEDVALAATPAVMLEYDDVLKRPSSFEGFGIGAREVNTILDALAMMARETYPRFRFRPFLDDPKDDLFIECALAAGARVIVTDDRHFMHPDVAAFGITPRTASDFVRELRMGRTST